MRRTGTADGGCAAAFRVRGGEWLALADAVAEEAAFAAVAAHHALVGHLPASRAPATEARERAAAAAVLAAFSPLTPIRTGEGTAAAPSSRDGLRALPRTVAAGADPTAARLRVATGLARRLDAAALVAACHARGLRHVATGPAAAHALASLAVPAGAGWGAGAAMSASARGGVPHTQGTLGGPMRPAEALAQSGPVPRDHGGKPADMLRDREAGPDPLRALRGIAGVNGRPAGGRNSTTDQKERGQTRRSEA